MNQSFQEFLLIAMQLSLGKMIKINKFENQFPNLKPDFGFKIPTIDCRFSWGKDIQLHALVDCYVQLGST